MAMKKTKTISCALVPLFVLTAFSGVGLHGVGHSGGHGAWHTWAAAHAVAGLAFMFVVLCHVWGHKGWYKKIGKRGRKDWATVAVSLGFVLVSLSGLFLIWVEGANSPAGLWHYKIGIVSGVAFGVHAFRRRRALLPKSPAGKVMRL